MVGSDQAAAERSAAALPEVNQASGPITGRTNESRGFRVGVAAR